jgi:hypothetical protein
MELLTVVYKLCFGQILHTKKVLDGLSALGYLGVIKGLRLSTKVGKLFVNNANLIFN